MNHRLVALTALALMLFATFVARSLRRPAAEPPTASIQPDPNGVGPAHPTGLDGLVPAMPPRPADIDPPAPTQPVPPDRPQPGIDARRAERYSPQRELSPLEEIDRAVNLTPEQRPVVAALVSDREVRMTSAYSEAVLDKQDSGAGVQAVTRIYLDFDDQIRRSLAPDQQATYDAARVEGRIGSPMFVFRYGQ